MPEPVFNQINIIASDFDRTSAFYRHLGISLGEPVKTAAGAPFHASYAAPSGLIVEVDSPEFARSWNPGWAKAPDLDGRVVLGFRVAERAAVDRVFDAIVAAGHRALQPPHDAFWGARYAIVEDPTGISIGIMSPVDEKHRSPPPGF